MTHPQLSAREVKAQILREAADAPIQLILSPEAATGLAFIADDFARDVEPNCEEAKYLIKLAELVAIRLGDCVAARVPGVQIGQLTETALAS